MRRTKKQMRRSFNRIITIFKILKGHEGDFLSKEGDFPFTELDFVLL
jgi:hypothetical protein